MLFEQLNQQLNSLSILLVQLTDDDYQRPIAALGNASIGEHSRHIIELAQCTIQGAQSGTVDYIYRNRNLTLQQNRHAAINALANIQQAIILPDQKLKMIVAPAGEIDLPAINTNYLREIVYITDHTIHHMAIIKIALRLLNLNWVNDEFGMAYATIQYKAQNGGAGHPENNLSSLKMC